MSKDKLPRRGRDSTEEILLEISKRIAGDNDKDTLGIARRFKKSHFISEAYPIMMQGFLGYCMKQLVEEKVGHDYEELGYFEPEPEFELFDYGAEDKEEIEIIFSGGYLCTIDDKQVAFLVRRVFDAGRAKVGVVVEFENQGMAVDLLKELKDKIKYNNIYKNKTISLTKGEPPTFVRDLSYTKEDIILPDAEWVEIEDNIMNFFNSINLYKEKGLPTKRGVLLEGKPGTGKTLLVKILCSIMNDCTRIIIAPDIYWDSDDIYSFYKMAKDLSPTLVIWEDIDIIAGPDRNAMVGSILQVLDGAIDTEGVITIASTNRSEVIDEALSKRPARFDRRLEFPIPNNNARLKMLEKFSSGLDLNDGILSQVSNQSEGLTGAALRELVMVAFMNSKRNNRDLITLDDFKVGKEKLKKISFSEPIGFKTGE